MSKWEGKNLSLQEQMKILEMILKENKSLWNLLKELEKVHEEYPSFNHYYVAAGCINQTILNYYHDYPITQGIEDYDIVYFDEDTSYEAEDKIIKEIERRVQNLDIKCDIKNEKRVPLWYNEKYHENREDYTSTEDAISKWTTTITSIGVRLEKRKLIICAPYGLEDLFEMIIRPNKAAITKEIYQNKCQKWKKKWPNITILEWK